MKSGGSESGSSNLELRVGEGTPNEGTNNCWQTRRGIEHVCMSWDSYARLLIEYTNPHEDLQCYKFNWDFSSENAHIKDCFLKKSFNHFVSSLFTNPGQHWAISDVIFNETMPASGYEVEQGYDGSYEVQFTSNLNERVLFVSTDGAFVVTTSIQSPVAITSDNDRFCFDYNRAKDKHSYSIANLAEFRYSVCTSTNPHLTVKLTKEHYLKTEVGQASSDLNVNSYLSATVDTLFWKFHPFSETSAEDLDTVFNFTWTNENKLRVPQHVIILQGHFPDEVELLSEDIVNKLVGEVNRRSDVRVYFEVSPYFAVTNKNFITGTNNGYWLQDYNENAPALSVLENVKTFLDPTNSEALDWYQNLLSGSMAKLKAAGAVIGTDTVSKLPNEFKSKTEIGYPYQVIEKFITEVSAMLETNNSSSNFTLLTSVQESKTGNACIVLDNLQFTWE
ncbi:uncharacterized protein LOC142354225 [Convolutriloba macropyga]|uniref:uncharacterized protein LOC142354225 n=1 Tax=Convolutriloba macropyga TaxID=536237 RepID=UPI003F51DFFF